MSAWDELDVLLPLSDSSDILRLFRGRFMALLTLLERSGKILKLQ